MNMRCSFALWGAVLVAAAAARAQQATYEYLCPSGRTWADMNDHGQVVFRTSDPNSGGFGLARYTDGAGLQELLPATYWGISPPQVNNAGQIAVTTRAPGRGFEAALYTPGMGITQLNTLGSGESGAYGLNNLGQVVGNVVHQWNDVAFRFDPSSGMHVVPGAGGSPGMNAATGINDAGQIAGVWSDPQTRLKAVRYTPGLGIEIIGTLGGTEAYAQGINSRGDVFGWSETAAGVEHNFLYTDETGMVDLGVLALTLQLTDMNDETWISGTDYTSHTAVIWSPNTGFIDLNSLLPAGMPGTLWEALSVNNEGQVLAWGDLDGRHGLYRITVLQLPEPGAAAAMVLMAVSGCRRRRGRGTGH